VTELDRRAFLLGGVALAGVSLTGCATPSAQPSAGSSTLSPAGPTAAPTSVSPTPSSPAPATPTAPAKPQVFFTKDISPAGLLAAYGALGVTAQGKVAVKISTGEPGGNNYLHPALIKQLVQQVRGTIVECGTAYNGKRADPKSHYQVAVDHGFTAIAKVEILDAKGTMELPVAGGVHLTKNVVGARFADYDFYLILSHFKGHIMAGFGGAIKNLAIGLASASGKSLIHSGGASKTGTGGGTAQEVFLEAMAEAAKSVTDRLGSNVVYVNVMNRLSVDCDCMSNPAPPAMADIGVLSGLDPVALDQACVDLVYAAPDGKPLVERMESRKGPHVLDHGASIGLGKKAYQLVRID